MFFTRIARLTSRALQLYQPSLEGTFPRYRRLMLQEGPQFKSHPRWLSHTTSLSSPSIKGTLTRNNSRDAKAKPRFAEDRKSSVYPVLDPKEAVGIVLRPSTIEDCPAIHKCLVAQADWEGCADLVSITVEDLMRDGFGPNPLFYCDVAVAHGEDGESSIIGYGLYTLSYCAWGGRTAAWENMFIHPEYRDLGIGSFFLHEMTKKMYFEQGCRIVTGYFDENEIGLKRWYEQQGFESLTKKFNFHLYSQEGANLERYVHKKHSNTEYLKKASDCGIYVESTLTTHGCNGKNS